MSVKNKAGLFVVTVIAIATVFSVVYASKTKKSADFTKKRVQTWVFTGTQLSQATDTSFYQLNPSTLPAGCGSGTQLPCELMISDDAINNREALHNYIASEFDNDPQQVLENSASQKPIP